MSRYTVQIEASTDDAASWQALGPSENIETAQWGPNWTAEDVANTTADNQTLAEGHNWRVLVWDGFDVDTSTPPAATLDSQQVLDRQADAADVWERDRGAYEAHG